MNTSSEKPVSVLHIISCLEVGGMQKVLVQLLPELKDEGIEPTVFSLLGRGPLSAPLDEAGIGTVYPFLPDVLTRLPKILKRLSIIFFVAFPLIKFMLLNRPVIVHMSHPYAYILGGGAALMTRVPIKIMHRHNRNSYQNKYPFVRFIERTLHKKMSLLLSVSLSVSEDLLSETDRREKIRTLYNGVKIQKRISDHDRNKSRAALGISRDTVVFVITANLHPCKNHQFLLESLAMVKQELAEKWALFVIGEDLGTLKQLTASAERLGLQDKIHWLGVQHDVRYFLSASDVGILCSDEEAFGIAILEYMEAGLPAIVTNVGGPAEIVIDQQTGLVVEPRDCVSLSSAILRLHRDRQTRLKMGDLGRKRVVKCFSLEASNRNYINMYKELVGQIQQ